MEQHAPGAVVEPPVVAELGARLADHVPDVLRQFELAGRRIFDLVKRLREAAEVANRFRPRVRREVREITSRDKLKLARQEDRARVEGPIAICGATGPLHRS